jgi:hypothetical protein
MKHAVKTSRRLNLITASLPLVICLVAGIQAADVHKLRGAPPDPLHNLIASIQSADHVKLHEQAPVPATPLLNTTAMRRSLEELSIAENANKQAKAAAKAAMTQRQSFASHVTIKKAVENYEKVEALVPEARAAALKTRMYAAEARQHSDHTLEIEKGYSQIPEMAADRAKEAVQGWIMSDAKASAEASAVSPANAAKTKAEKIAANVAAAAEPYHIALLRNQKFAAETYQKAKTAQESSKALQMKAQKMALTAQTLQSSGLGVDAQSMMGEASGMMQEAENLRQWGDKLYKQASTASESTGIYAGYANQAATNAAMTTVVNAPMKLP